MSLLALKLRQRSTSPVTHGRPSIPTTSIACSWRCKWMPRTSCVIDQSCSSELVDRQNEDIAREYKERRRRATAGWNQWQRDLNSQDRLLDSHVTSDFLELLVLRDVQVCRLRELHDQTVRLHAEDGKGRLAAMGKLNRFWINGEREEL
eukprot:754792-Hanusia_phi.AAC.3